MKFEPSYLQRLTGTRFFNAGVHYASAEDFLAWYRHYVRTTGQAPRRVLLGLDVSTFADSATADARLFGCPEMTRELSDVLTLRDRLVPYLDLLSWTQTRASVRALLATALDRIPKSDEHYEPDGLLIYDRREMELAEGKFDLAAPLKHTTEEYTQKFQHFGRPSLRQLHLLEQLATACREDRVELIAFYTTSHPAQYEQIVERTNYQSAFESLHAALSKMANKYQFSLVDLTRIEAFGGDPEQFVDGIHPLEYNTRRMLDVLLATESHHVGP